MLNLHRRPIGIMVLLMLHHNHRLQGSTGLFSRVVLPFRRPCGSPPPRGGGPVPGGVGWSDRAKVLVVETTTSPERGRIWTTAEPSGKFHLIIQFESFRQQGKGLKDPYPEVLVSTSPGDNTQFAFRSPDAYHHEARSIIDILPFDRLEKGGL